MIIEKVDKIMLTYKEYEEIATWVKKQKFESVDITLKEGIVIMNDISHMDFNIGVGIYFRIDSATGNMFIQQYDMKNMVLIFSATIDERFFKDGYIDIDMPNSIGRLVDSISRVEQSAKVSILTVLDIFQYMNHYKENVIVKKESKSVRIKSKNNKSTTKKNKTSIVSLSSKRYSFTSTSTNSTTSSCRGINAKEVWSVKGHWRHYQNGTKAWVKPYKKGLGEVREGKVYKKMG